MAPLDGWLMYYQPLGFYGDGDIKCSLVTIVECISSMKIEVNKNTTTLLLLPPWN